MKVAKSLLLGSAAVLATVAGAQAADLPTRKAAPVQYVKICDAYGAGFFYIPGTDTCLRVGGLVAAQMRIQGSSQMWASTPGSAGSALSVANLGYIQSQAAFRTANGYTRDQIGYDANANVELDARTQSPWGTVRTFIRLSSTFGTGINSTTGSYGGLLQNTTGAIAGYQGAMATVGKEFTYLNKAFIQFAGITMGRAQSMFDFYGDAFNYEALRGSNQNVWELAYTATFGGGFSATLSFEDSQSHRGPVASVISAAGYGVGGTFGGTASAFGVTPSAARLPDIIANLRVDQPWGSAQLAAALHPVRAAAYWNFQPVTAPIAVANKTGFAISGGVMFKLDSLSPGDQLWLQAIYSKGAIGYVSGTDMAFVGSPNLTQNYGFGLARQSNAYGWNNATDNDCVFTYSGSCDLSTNVAVTAALKHYWSPTVSSGLFGSFYSVAYSNAATTPISAYSGNGGLMTFGGITNYRETRLGTNLVWTPVKGFDIGGELTWIRGVTSRPFGLTPDAVLMSQNLPAWKGVNDAFYGKVRMIRAF